MAEVTDLVDFILKFILHRFRWGAPSILITNWYMASSKDIREFGQLRENANLE